MKSEFHIQKNKDWNFNGEKVKPGDKVSEFHIQKNKVLRIFLVNQEKPDVKHKVVFG